MLAGFRIAVAHHLNPFVGEPDGVAAAVADHIHPLRAKEFGRRRGGTGGKQKGKQNQAHGPILARKGLTNPYVFFPSSPRLPSVSTRAALPSR